MAEIKLEGLYELDRALSDRLSMDAVKRVVQQNGDQMNVRMKQNTRTAFRKGYSTGDTAGSICTEFSDGGLTSTVEPATEYAAYVEFGTRFMTAEPFVKPAFTEQKEQFKKDMDRLVK